MSLVTAAPVINITLVNCLRRRLQMQKRTIVSELVTRTFEVGPRLRTCSTRVASWSRSSTTPVVEYSRVIVTPKQVRAKADTGINLHPSIRSMKCLSYVCGGNNCTGKISYRHVDNCDRSIVCLTRDQSQMRDLPTAILCYFSCSCYSRHPVNYVALQLLGVHNI